MQPIKTEELRPLADFLNTMYNGDIAEINHFLCEAIYMLHYVPDDIFEDQEKKEVSFLLHKIQLHLHKIREIRESP